MNIHYKWQPANQLPLYIGETYADIRIEAGDAIVTRHTDERNLDNPLKPLDSIEASAYPLAYWFAENWWRLLYDINTERELWKEAHNLIYAADGYIWPYLRFLSDEHSMILTGSQDEDERRGVIQYFADLPPEGVRISIENFKSVIQDFVEATIRQANNTDRDLPFTWAAVREEEGNEEFRLYRKIEARLGYAPNDAPEELVDRYRVAIKKYGLQSVMDMASDNLLSNVENCTFGHKGEWKLYPYVNEQSQEQEPWREGYRMAQQARKYLGIPEDKSIDNQKLSDVFHLSQRALTQQWGENKEMKVGLLQRHSKGQLSLYVGGAMRHENKRFMTARLIGAQILAPAEENLLVCNSTNTWDQQCQRAFAAEFLLPQTIVEDNISGNNFRTFENLAKHYGVSTHLVEFQYENMRKEGTPVLNNHYEKISD